MAIDAGANRDDAEPDDEELDAEAEERAADEGMPPPDEAPETSGELESQKLDDGRLPSHSRNDELGTDGADISGPVPGDD
jgi:hypothetical protein